MLDALEVEFGFARVDFPPKCSKTERIVLILAKTFFLLHALDVEFGFSRVDFPPKGLKTQSLFCNSCKILVFCSNELTRHVGIGRGLAKTVFLLEALEVEFGFSRVGFPPKGSKTQSVVVIPAKA